ncbi:MAG: nucleoside triphosphate pyrophosphohydrolase [Acidobacteriota bacterium]
MTIPETAGDLQSLVDLVARLRAPDGCPWDREQALADVRAYLIEEAHELAAAIDSGDPEGLREELGDLLFQAAFIARLADEAGHFSAEDAVAAVHRKMVERHPHVFGDEALGDADAVRRAWERRKVESGGPRPLLEGVAPSLPALVGAYRLTQKAAGVGFDWPDAEAVLAKVKEELAEVEEVLPRGGAGQEDRNRTELEDEVGDLLFAVANLARHLGLDPEATLAKGNLKFRRRFGAVEQALLRDGRTLNDVDLEDMDRLWNEVKRQERGG